MKRFPAAHLFIFAAISLYLFIHASFDDGDYTLFYQATHLFQQRFNPYSLAAFPHSYGFAYPPIALLIMWIPSLIPWGFSLIFWSLCCYFMLTWSVYAWFDLLTGSTPDFEEFVWCFLLACIAPVFWSFWLHQLTMPVFFFATLSLWLIKRKNAVFLAGMAGGLLLLKPHLSLPFLALLMMRTPRKGGFLAGFLLITVLSIAPFLSGYRPFTDLRDWKNAIERHSMLLHNRDDQAIPIKIYQALRFSAQDKLLLIKYNVRDNPNFMGNLPLIRKENNFKKYSFAMLLGAWIAWLFGMRKKLDANVCALALTIGVLISSYSHFYDGILLIPLMLWAGFRLAHSWGLANVAAAAMFASFFLTLAIPFNANPNTPIYWERTAYASCLYLFIAMAAGGYETICRFVSRMIFVTSEKIISNKEPKYEAT